MLKEQPPNIFSDIRHWLYIIYKQLCFIVIYIHNSAHINAITKYFRSADTNNFILHTLVNEYSALSIYRGQFSLNNSWKTSHSPPVKARYGVSTTSARYDRSSTIAAVGLCALSSYIELYMNALHTIYTTILTPNVFVPDFVQPDSECIYMCV